MRLNSTNMRSKIFILMIVLLMLSGRVYSQHYYEDDLQTYRIGIEYQIPENFSQVPDTQEDYDLNIECFDSESIILQKSFTCQMNRFNSDDGCVKVFTKAYEIDSKEDSIRNVKMAHYDTRFPRNTFHIPYIGIDIAYFYGVEARQHWKEYVYYYPDEEARKICNADTLIFYTLKLNDGEYFQNRYNRIAVYCMQKNERGFFNVYCFYDDQAANNPEKYLEPVLKAFRFKEPFEKMKIPKRDNLIFLSRPQKRSFSEKY